MPRSKSKSFKLYITHNNSIDLKITNLFNGSQTDSARKYAWQLHLSIHINLRHEKHKLCICNQNDKIWKQWTKLILKSNTSHSWNFRRHAYNIGKLVTVLAYNDSTTYYSQMAQLFIYCLLNKLNIWPWIEPGMFE